MPLFIEVQLHFVEDRASNVFSMEYSQIETQSLPLKWFCCGAHASKYK